MKKKIFAAILAGTLAVTALAGCGAGTDSTASADSTADSTAAEASGAETASDKESTAEVDTSNASVTLKLAATKASENYMYQGMEMFEQLVEQNSNGDISVELYPASQLGGQTEIVEGMQMGTIEMAFLGPAVAESFLPEAGIPSMLFLAQNEEHALKIWTESEYAQKVLADMETQLNIHTLDFCIEGTRTVWTTKEVTKLEDLNGVKLRVPEVPTFVNAFTNLGCSPTIMSMSEVYTGLQTGIVEGLENDISTILSNNFADQCKYCYRTNHGVSLISFMIAQSVWDGLTEEQQSILSDASAQACDMLNEEYYVQLAAAEEELAADGVTFTTPTDEEYTKMQELVQPVIDEAIEGLATEEDLEAMRSLAG